MTKHFPKPPFKAQQQSIPGRSDKMDPQPDYGEATYRGSNKLKDKKAVITGADSGIGRAVALAFAREGADVLVSYLDEHDDANETKRLVEGAGRKCVLLAGDVSTSDHCRQIVKRAVDEFGRIDVLVNNAAHQMSFNSIEEISDEDWEKTLSTNISAMFYIVKAAAAHMPEGSSIINTASTRTLPILICWPTPPQRSDSEFHRRAGPAFG
jgi:NAD(P)-dependent dehydrogenase (short-subunit alcohol dehydrogenase family)